MPYSGFWGLCALTLVLLGHSIYIWRTATKGQALRPLPKRAKLVLGLLWGLCAAAFAGGIIMMLCRMEEAAIHVMGLVVLLSAFAFNDRLRGYLPDLIKKEEQEEIKDE